MMIMMKILMKAICSLFFVALFAQTLFAAEPFQLEPIVVTAKKIEQDSQYVPMSITVIDRETMEQARLSALQDIGDFTPNLSIRQSSSDLLRRITIRGVGAYSRNIGFDTRAGAYLDGVYLGQSPALNHHLFDLEQVEVLRGPQGTIFGKNTIAGAIHLITQKPKDEFESKVFLEAGNDDYHLIQATLNTPVVKDKCFARLSASHTERDGLYTNLFDGKDLDGGHTNAIRAQIRTDVSDRGEFTASFDGVFSERDVVLGDALTDTFAMSLNMESPGKYDVNYNVMPDEKNDQYGISGTIEYEVGNNTLLTGIGAYRHTAIRSRIDLDYSSNDFAIGDVDDRYRQFSQEIRLNSTLGTGLGAVWGLYYVRQDARTHRNITFGSDILMIGDPRLFSGNDVPNDGEVITDSYAVFLNANCQLIDKLNVEVGCRYTYEEKDADYQLDGSQSGFFNIATWSFRDTYSDGAVTPSANLIYTFSENAVGYAGVSTGFKSGGFNLDWLTEKDVASGVAYDKESVVNYEAGIKINLFDQRVKTDLSVFYAQYEDYQVQQFIDLGGSATAISISNAAEVTSKGAECQISIKPTPQCRIIASMSLLDASFDRFPNAGREGTDASGNDLPFAPTFTSTVGVEYSLPISTWAATLKFRGDWFYTDDYYTHSSNVTSQLLANGSRVPFGFVEGYHLLSGRIALTPSNKNWSVFLWGKNITDEKYITNSDRDFCGAIIVGRGIRRTVGAGISFRF